MHQLHEALLQQKWHRAVLQPMVVARLGNMSMTSGRASLHWTGSDAESAEPMVVVVMKEMTIAIEEMITTTIKRRHRHDNYGE